MSPTPTGDPGIVDNDEASRYELHIDDELIGVVDYSRRGDLVVMPHVEIDPAHGGQGLGHRLVRAALDDVRSRGEKVRPLCPFVRAFIAENEDYVDLVG